jgi:hypothetical protein
MVGSKHSNYNGSSSNMPAGASNRSIFEHSLTSSQHPHSRNMRVMLIASLIVLALSLAAADTSATVSTASGQIRGSISPEGDVASFFNVPYAESPEHSLRWAAPVPKQPWNTTLDCTQTPSYFRDSCPELHIVDRVFIGREDCLKLNIYAPWPLPSDAPVMIFIPGGGYIVGSGYHHGLYDGAQLARSHGAVVIVMQCAPHAKHCPCSFALTIIPAPSGIVWAY